MLDAERLSQVVQVADEVSQGEKEARSEALRFSIRDQLRAIRDLIETAQISMEKAIDLSEDTVWAEDVLKAGDATEELHSLVDNLQDQIGRW